MPFTRRGPHGNKLRLRPDRLRLPFTGLALRFDRLDARFPPGRLELRLDGLGLPFHRLALRFNRLSLERLGSALGRQTVHPGRRIGEPGRGCGVFPARPRVGPGLRR